MLDRFLQATHRPGCTLLGSHSRMSRAHRQPPAIMLDRIESRRAADGIPESVTNGRTGHLFDYKKGKLFYRSIFISENQNPLLTFASFAPLLAQPPVSLITSSSLSEVAFKATVPIKLEFPFGTSVQFRFTTLPSIVP
jgi:hypothetical protein